ncbi:hypothetical protein [Clavibacter michiganensis]|uniref:hypothetical protein n=1 Tax=Clavibacter michiganensis TaxID=28447 RepID=UPI0013652C45|nr:hypothetical protein [Clavibacter michiganensis]
MPQHADADERAAGLLVPGQEVEHRRGDPRAGGDQDGDRVQRMPERHAVQQVGQRPRLQQRGDDALHAVDDRIQRLRVLDPHDRLDQLELAHGASVRGAAPTPST